MNLDELGDFNTLFLKIRYYFNYFVISRLFDQVPSWAQPREEVMSGFSQQPTAPQAAAAAFLMSQSSLALMQSSQKAERPQPHSMPPPHPTGPTPSFR